MRISTVDVNQRTSNFASPCSNASEGDKKTVIGWFRFAAICCSVSVDGLGEAAGRKTTAAGLPPARVGANTVRSVNTTVDMLVFDEKHWHLTLLYSLCK